MIVLQGLTKRFDGLTAVDHLSLEVKAGEVMALLGPNGAGKTTTVRMLSAMLRPTAGRARVAGYDTVREPREVRRRVGVLTEAPGLYLRMTGREYLTFFGEVRGVESSRLQQRIDALAERFKMREALARRLGTYSKGMRQKIALIRTLLHEPPVLLLDEPTSAMDPESARLVRDAIHSLRDGHRAVLICTHNLPEAEELADRIAIIGKGRILAQGSPAALKERYLGPPPLRLQVAGRIDPALLARLDAFGEVLDYGRRWVRFRKAEGVRNADVLRALLRDGWEVDMLVEEQQSLESLYLRVVQGATTLEVAS